MPESDPTIFSFVVDTRARFTYEGWHLARSLIQHCGGDPTAVHVHFTPEVEEGRRALFRELGCTSHEMARFGDGRHCNKLNQLDNFGDVDFDRVVLLDTDTVAISDIRPFLRNDVILGKTVDAARPPLAVLDEIAGAAGMTGRPQICKTDLGKDGTYLGNCNGGFYSVPKSFCSRLSAEWRRWALWLLDHKGPLERADMPQHVDQVSFWLAIHLADLPFALAPANVNFFPYLGGGHCYFDRTRDIALVHYHSSLNANGLLDMRPGRRPHEAAAIRRANRQLANRFDNRAFWDFRYERYPALGSGSGSRGVNIAYRQQLLRDQGIERAGGVLDVGCGDLTVLKDLAIRRYVGVDQSATALARARAHRPHWEFRLAPALDVDPAEMVLCFDVLIHQETEAAYLAMIGFLAEKTSGSLLVSGFEKSSKGIEVNRVLFFYEPLETSLRRTRRFRRIEKVGAYSTVVVYRCDV
jgi:hypothetical protein